MEMMKLSKFRLQLQALVCEVRHLREREHFTAEQLRVSIQKQKQSEEESARKLKEVQAQLDLSNEQRVKLERKVNSLQNDNDLLENKHKEMKGTIDNLLQSRETFAKAYEDSTNEMIRSIQNRDKKLAILSEKLNAHSLLFDSVQKEAFSVKQVVDNVQHLMSEKEGIVAGLKGKMEKLCTYEKAFLEKISDLESKLRNKENQLHIKEKKISQLEAHLEEVKISNNSRSCIEELQKTISTNDVVIQNLLSEKKALQLELQTLGIITQKIQHAVVKMNDEDAKVFSLVLGGGEEGSEMAVKETRDEDLGQNIGKSSHCRTHEKSTPEDSDSVCQETDSASKCIVLNHNVDSCVSEVAQSGPHLVSHPLNVAASEAKDNCTRMTCHQDSESSTTQGEETC